MPLLTIICFGLQTFPIFILLTPRLVFLDGIKWLYFFTYSPPHALHAATNESTEYLFDYGFISKFASKASLVASRLVNHRVFGSPHNQSKFVANYTYHVDTSGNFCVLWCKLCARDPTPKVKFPGKWLASLAAMWLRLSFLSRGSGCIGIKCRVENLLTRANKLP